MPTGKYNLSDIDQPGKGAQVHTGISASRPVSIGEQGVSTPPAGEGEAVTTGPYNLSDIEGTQANAGTPPPEERFSTRLAKEIPGAIGRAGIGALKGASNTVRNIGNFEAKIPGIKSMLPGDVQDFLGPEGEKITTPHGGAQRLGYGGEQAGEFMLPGGAEEKLAGLAPKVIRPLAKIGTSALGAGLVNKAQGGEFGTGAIAGGTGAALGQGLNAIAPAIAEKALGIRGKFDRSFNKAPGLAALTETSGIRPETIANQARERIGDLSAQTERMADNASSKPIRGFLPAPTREIPLATASGRNPKMRPMAFPAEVNPEEPMVPRSGNPMAPISEYPGINPHYLSGTEHPELSGRIPASKGVLIRPGEAQIGHPTTTPSRIADLTPARNVVGQSIGQAARENAEGTHGQLSNMQDFLSRRFTTGEPIPAKVTPRELLDLRRGFNEEHGRWNPDLHDTTVTTGRRAYGALTGEFHRVLPEAAPLDERISSLIPVKNRAQSIALNDNPLQKGFGRIAAHSGALAGTIAGGYEGRREGGIPGMIAGGALGLMGPELLASPEGQMALARSLYKARALRPMTGAALQFDRNGEGK